MAPSSSGLGLWLLKPATRVRIPSGLPISFFTSANFILLDIQLTLLQLQRLRRHVIDQVVYLIFQSVH